MEPCFFMCFRKTRKNRYTNDELQNYCTRYTSCTKLPVRADPGDENDWRNKIARSDGEGHSTELTNFEEHTYGTPGESRKNKERPNKHHECTVRMLINTNSTGPVANDGDLIKNGSQEQKRVA